MFNLFHGYPNNILNVYFKPLVINFFVKRYMLCAITMCTNHGYCTLCTASIEIDAFNAEDSTGQLKIHCGGLQMFKQYICSVI